MKKFIITLFAAALTLSVHASTYTFKPNDGEGDTDDMFDLDHHDAYTWGITAATTGNYNTLKSQLNGAYSITSAKITFYNIWDWVKEDNDRLWVRLLDTTKKGVKTYHDNAADVENPDPTSDYFYGQGTLINFWTDPNGGNSNQAINLTFTFTNTQLATLDTYITNGGYTSGTYGNTDFGFSFDPDCHYYNTGIEVTICTGIVTVPEGGMTAVMLGLGLLGLAWAARRTKKL